MVAVVWVVASRAMLSAPPLGAWAAVVLPWVLGGLKWLVGMLLGGLDKEVVELSLAIWALVEVWEVAWPMKWRPPSLQ